MIDGLSAEERDELQKELVQAEIALAELISANLRFNECTMVLAMMSLAASVSIQSGFVEKHDFMEQCSRIWDRAIAISQEYHRVASH